MNTVYRSSLFDSWLRSLRDKAAQARIFNRILNVETGSLGDYKALGGGLYELRVHHGPGYRLYFTRNGETVVFLLAGGDKSSQNKDIIRARKLMEE
jgi:putative addiction module killer protein